MGILELDNCPLSDRNSTYYGMAGQKEGVLIDGEPWIVKYPKNTVGMRGNVDSYTTAPLSEYIGSHVYEILGYDVHKTELGCRNDKIVVACKDFCEYTGQLVEFRGFKNVYNKELEQVLEMHLSSTGSDQAVELKEILIHLEHNPSLQVIPGLTDRFWDCIIVDGLINNNDRNNGNWGMLRKDGKFCLSPVYDNGAAFANKVSEASICKRLDNPKSIAESALNIISIYADNGKNYTFRNLIKECMHYPAFRAAVKRNVPLIQSRLPEIAKFMEAIPITYKGLLVCSMERRTVYLKDMQVRLEQLLIPALERANELDQQAEQKPLSLTERIAKATAQANALNAGCDAGKAAPEHGEPERE